MNVSELLNKARRFADENSPVILTGMAVSGACISAYLAAKAGFKSSEILSKTPDIQAVDFDGEVRGRELTNQEKFLITYKLYIPAVATLAGTSACMIMATKIGLDRTAAMAGALVVSERTYDQYRDKVKETLGENKHTKIDDAVAQDQVTRTPLPPAELSEGEQWCFDRWSGRFFKSSMESIKQSLNQFNEHFLNEDSMSLTDFYNWIGLDEIQQSDYVGWRREDGLLELDITSVLKDNRACIAIGFKRAPMATFQNNHG